MAFVTGVEVVYLGVKVDLGVFFYKDFPNVERLEPCTYGYLGPISDVYDCGELVSGTVVSECNTSLFERDLDTICKKLEGLLESCAECFVSGLEGDYLSGSSSKSLAYGHFDSIAKNHIRSFDGEFAGCPVYLFSKKSFDIVQKTLITGSPGESIFNQLADPGCFGSIAAHVFSRAVVNILSKNSKHLNNKSYFFKDSIQKYEKEVALDGTQSIFRDDIRCAPLSSITRIGKEEVWGSKYCEIHISYEPGDDMCMGGDNFSTI